MGASSALSVHRAPVTAVAGHQPAGDEENQIHEPPDPQSSQRQQFPHGGPSVAQAEPIHSEATQEKRVEQRGYEVVPSVPAMEGVGWGGWGVGGAGARVSRWFLTSGLPPVGAGRGAGPGRRGWGVVGGDRGPPAPPRRAHPT